MKYKSQKFSHTLIVAGLTMFVSSIATPVVAAPPEDAEMATYNMQGGTYSTVNRINGTRTHSTWDHGVGNILTTDSPDVLALQEAGPLPNQSYYNTHRPSNLPANPPVVDHTRRVDYHFGREVPLDGGGLAHDLRAGNLKVGRWGEYKFLHFEVNANSPGDRLNMTILTKHDISEIHFLPPTVRQQKFDGAEFPMTMSDHVGNRPVIGVTIENNGQRTAYYNFHATSASRNEAESQLRTIHARQSFHVSNAKRISEENSVNGYHNDTKKFTYSRNSGFNEVAGDQRFKGHTTSSSYVVLGDFNKEQRFHDYDTGLAVLGKTTADEPNGVLLRSLETTHYSTTSHTYGKLDYAYAHSQSSSRFRRYGAAKRKQPSEVTRKHPSDHRGVVFGEVSARDSCQRLSFEVKRRKK